MTEDRGGKFKGRDRGDRFAQRPPRKFGGGKKFATGKKDGRQDKPRRPQPAPPTDGLQARDVAVSSLYAVFVEKRAFDDAFNKAAETRGLVGRDRAFARLIAANVLRHHGELRAVVNSFLEKPLQGRLELVLLSAAAQLLFLNTPPHAAISLAVDQTRMDKGGQRFDKLTNAVLRRVAERGPEILATIDGVLLNVPDWLMRRWEGHYGVDQARAIAEASLREAALDLSVKDDVAGWAARLGGTVLMPGAVRLSASGRIEDLPGYDEGAWWVQDLAASLPARLLGEVAGKSVADLCAAPGGKTAQLVAAGADVVAVDKSPGRLRRLDDNLLRLRLKAETLVADAAAFAPGRSFDAILVDAPCTATGTIRRHPDILLLKREEDIAALAALQARILSGAAAALKPGGVMVYCTCSLEPEEGERQVAAFLDAHGEFRRAPVDAATLGFDPAWMTADGDLRTLPCHFADEAEGLSGMDGFFAARLERIA